MFVSKKSVFCYHNHSVWLYIVFIVTWYCAAFLFNFSLPCGPWDHIFCPFIAVFIKLHHMHETYNSVKFLKLWYTKVFTWLLKGFNQIASHKLLFNSRSYAAQWLLVKIQCHMMSLNVKILLSSIYFLTHRHMVMFTLYIWVAGSNRIFAKYLLSH